MGSLINRSVYSNKSERSESCGHPEDLPVALQATF